MTKTVLWRTAMEQSALELGCRVEDFLADKPVVVDARPCAAMRVYYQPPFPCNIVSYGNNAVASVSPECREAAETYLNRYPWYHCFETPNLHELDALLAPLGVRTCYMAEYWLPNLEQLTPLDCAYPLKWLTRTDFQTLYLPEWSNALCANRPEHDEVGIAAFDGETLVGFAACSSDCDSMWQIGVDVLPAYRRRGIASALTSRLALEILRRNKVPFYCCAWSNLPSAKNAVRSGFRPAWVELTCKPAP